MSGRPQRCDNGAEASSLASSGPSSPGTPSEAGDSLAALVRDSEPCTSPPTSEFGAIGDGRGQATDIDDDEEMRRQVALLVDSRPDGPAPRQPRVKSESREEAIRRHILCLVGEVESQNRGSSPELAVKTTTTRVSRPVSWPMQSRPMQSHNTETAAQDENADGLADLLGFLGLEDDIVSHSVDFARFLPDRGG
ncbi:hypothetical protein CDD82_5848 [Ophiocordyceps australis]|uniref:Uncharacterized protein n=1 Tax=Ophiocordyceps australis TaxID=1399860 RepID=A0A2C5Z0J0_9HYPO|nr:hypothetical protein CDD82_5848 [Ophiocordyceps australis]